MGRIVRMLIVAAPLTGLVGCTETVKEGGPPPNVGYVAPQDAAESAPPAKAARK
jgi:hypothetical protein